MGKIIRCRDELSSRTEFRKESLRKKLRQVETETQSPELVEEFEAKRDRGSEAEESVDCLNFWSARTLFSGRCEAMSEGLFVCAGVA